MEVEVIPAILVKTRIDLLERINQVKGSVSTVHIDVMDSKFVPNKTIGPEAFRGLPENLSYEFHWMVQNPQDYISETKGNHMHIVHVEAITDWEAIKKAVKDSGGTLGLAISPSTEVEKLRPFLKDVSRVLVMSVNPGFDGQRYMASVEEKIRFLRKNFPSVQVEVDGGINASTARSASAAGATKLAASSAVYSSADASGELKRIRDSVAHSKGAST